MDRKTMAIRSAVVLVLGSQQIFACDLHAVNDMALNLTGLVGKSTNTTINNAVKTISADVQSVSYNTTNSYIKSTGIPSDYVGPFPGNPNTPANRNYTFRVPRSPSIQGGTKTSTSLGPIGFMVNGVPFFNASDGNSYNSLGIWNQNANVVEASSFDAGMGHPAQGGVYHYHQQPASLRADLGDDGTHHSPLLGFAFDGFPVYGPFGYSNTDGTGGVKRIASSYVLRNITARTTKPDGTVLTSAQYGPAISTTFPLGYYLEDYVYTSGAGDLDQYNGRFAITPEYPGGTYAYFTTLDSLGKAAYPYIVGPQYYGVLQNDNRTQTVSVPTTGLTAFTPSLTTNWSAAANGAFCEGVNWSTGNAPMGAGTTANFAANGAGPVTVTMEGPQRIGTINFSATTNYSITGTSQLTVLSSSGSQINATAGNHSIGCPVVIASSTTMNVSSGAVLSLTNLQPTAASITKSGAGTLNLTSANCGTLTVSAGKINATNGIRATTLSLASGATASVAQNGSTSATSVITTLSISATAQLDLHDNDMVIKTTGGKTAIKNLITAGQNGLDTNGQNRWNGPGIVSSTARSQNQSLGVDVMTLAVIRNGDLNDFQGSTGYSYSTFSGQSVALEDVLVKYTYNGDANVDGSITIDDYNNIDGTYLGLTSSLGWVSGDFDYNGSITIDDYNAIDTGFLYQGGQLSQSMIAQRSEMFGADYVAHLEQLATAFAAVPEPAMMGLVAAGLIGMLARRRSRPCQ